MYQPERPQRSWTGLSRVIIFCTSQVVLNGVIIFVPDGTYGICEDSESFKVPKTPMKSI